LNIYVLSLQSFLIAGLITLVRYISRTGKIPNRAQLHKVLGTENRNLHYQAFYSDTAQQILTGVAESFKSFLGLLKGIKNGTVTQRPKLPGIVKGGMALVTFTEGRKTQDGMLRFPLGSKVKAWFGLDAFFPANALQS
jgi:hypothetical protein